MPINNFSRRTLLKAGAASLATAALPFGLARADTAVILGIVYVGPKDDFGWNQAHATSVATLKSLPGITVVEEENVPETDAVSKSMESMINLDGANLILATSFGYYSPFVVELAKKYPDVQFRHAAPLWNKDKDPKNAGSYFPYLNQAHYVDGVAAGLSSKSGKIGFVAAKPIPSVLSNINSVLLGARSVNPKATVQVIFTGDWSLPVREAEATNALVDAGCDLITCHVDSPKVVIQTAEGRGVKTCGHNASQAPLAPKGFVTGAEYKWETIYKQYADDIAAGQAAAELPGRRLQQRHAAQHGLRRRRDARGHQGRRRRHRRAQGRLQIYLGPPQGQHRQGRRRQGLRQLRPLPRRHELAARGRPGLDHLRSR